MSGEAEEGDGGVLVEFPSAGTFPPVLLENRFASKCRHVQTKLTADRALLCKTCGAAVDPIDALLAMGERWQTILSQERVARNRVDELELQEREATAKRDRARRHRDARAQVIVIADAEAFTKATALQVGESILGSLERHPVVIIETKDGKLLKPRRR